MSSEGREYGDQREDGVRMQRDGMATSGRDVRRTLHLEWWLMFGVSRASEGQDAQDAYNNFC